MNIGSYATFYRKWTKMCGIKINIQLRFMVQQFSELSTKWEYICDLKREIENNI